MVQTNFQPLQDPKPPDRTSHLQVPRQSTHWGKTHTHRFSLGARRALHAWQALIPFLTSLPRGANKADQSNVALEDKSGMCQESREGCWEVFS